jgi:hypothetical protein
MSPPLFLSGQCGNGGMTKVTECPALALMDHLLVELVPIVGTGFREG